MSPTRWRSRTVLSRGHCASSCPVRWAGCSTSCPTSSVRSSSCVWWSACRPKRRRRRWARHRERCAWPSTGHWPASARACPREVICMPDDRNDVPPGSPHPFGGVRGPNGSNGNGVQGRVDLPTRSLNVDVADGPVDLVAVQADDELVNALGAGAAVTYGDRSPGVDPDPRRHRDERLVAMLASWRAEIEAEPIPELIDLDTAVAAVVAGVKADAAGARRKRAARLRHLAPLAAAAAIIVATVTGVGLGSQNAMPGDALWPVQKVVNPERAESVETKLVVESRFDEVRTALETGDTETAAHLLQTISTEIPDVRG